MHHRTGLAILACLLAQLAGAQDLDIRFYPSQQIYAYELDATHGVRSVLLQNLAVVNSSKKNATIAELQIEVLAEGVARESRLFLPADLDRVGAGNKLLQSSGMLGVITFQFGGAKLLPENVRLAGARTLNPGEALLLTQQVLAFSGPRDALRVRVRTETGTQEASIPISVGRSNTTFRLPLEGVWHDGAGPSLHTHHRWVVPQEFAHDFTRVGRNGLAYQTDGLQLSDYLAYGQPVLAAAAGKVAAVLNDEPEDVSILQRPGETLEGYLPRLMKRQNEQLARGARGIVGNHVLIDHGKQEFSLYAHLKPGSVRVKAGEQVEQGQQIGSVGSSGSSTEPHLHFHVCDGPDVLLCVGIPARFENLEIYGALQPRELQSGDLVSQRTAPKATAVDESPSSR